MVARDRDFGNMAEGCQNYLRTTNRSGSTAAGFNTSNKCTPQTVVILVGRRNFEFKNGQSLSLSYNIIISEFDLSQIIVFFCSVDSVKLMIV